MVAILVLLTIIGFLTIDFLVQRAAMRKAAAVPVPVVARPSVSVRAPVDIAALPAGVFVGPGHAWMELRPSGNVRLGADRVPLTLLGGVDSVETAPDGAILHRGDVAAVLRKGERSVELRTPVDGVVTGVNTSPEAAPAALAANPFGAGWLVSLAPRNLAASLRRMSVAEEAGTWMRRELARLRDFLVGLGEGGALASATLPDGGLPVEGLAEHLTDPQWRRLTERFFDPSADAEEPSW